MPPSGRLTERPTRMCDFSRCHHLRSKPKADPIGKKDPSRVVLADVEGADCQGALERSKSRLYPDSEKGQAQSVFYLDARLRVEYPVTLSCDFARDEEPKLVRSQGLLSSPQNVASAVGGPVCEDLPLPPSTRKRLATLPLRTQRRTPPTCSHSPGANHHDTAVLDGAPMQAASGNGSGSQSGRTSRATYLKATLRSLRWRSSW